MAEPLESVDRGLPVLIYPDQEARDPHKFLEFLRTIPIENLLASRPAQAVLDRRLSFNFARNKEQLAALQAAGHVAILNPYPVLELKIANGANYMYGAFKLKDDDFYYYFPEAYPMADVPEFLRSTDVVPSQTFRQTWPAEVRQQIMAELRIDEDDFARLVYFQDPSVAGKAVLKDIPFNKPICRVAVKGGEAQRYNYRNQEWEVSGDGVYQRSFRDKMALLLRGRGGNLRKSLGLPGNNGTRVKQIAPPDK